MKLDALEMLEYVDLMDWKNKKEILIMKTMFNVIKYNGENKET